MSEEEIEEEVERMFNQLDTAYMETDMDAFTYEANCRAIQAWARRMYGIEESN